MSNRSSNVFSRALEREQEARQQRTENNNAQNDAQNDAQNGEQTAPQAFKPATDAQTARVLKMPIRRAFDAADDAETSESPIAKTVTPETWSWSQPPQLVASSDDLQPATIESSAPLSSNLNESETVATELVAPETTAKEAALIVVNKTALTANGSGAANNKIGAPSLRAAARPLFRTVTINAEAVEPHLVAITDPRSPHCEEFRNLRTRILHASQTQTLQAITIASTSPSEGKSTVALNLAWLLAQTDGINALLIDADLRLPCLADYLNVTASAGLSEVFSDQIKLEDAILRLAPANLHLLPGGAPRDDVAEMLSGNRFRTVLESARKMFDYIIVDAPSLGIFTDAAVLINQTDAALLVVRAGKTRFGLTNRMLETLPRERMFGVVLNGSSEGLANESHYDSYYYQNTRRRLELKEEGA